MLDSKTNAIIQCRFSSTRLPGKAMYPICGIPLLSFLIRRLKNGLPKENYRIIVATTRNNEDNPVAAWAEQENVHIIRGDLDDVLSRYILTLKKFPSDINIRVTADNPLTCPHILKAAVSLLREKKLDYVQTKNFPYGAGVDVFSDTLLKHLDTITTEPPDREHINNYVLKNMDKFKTETLQAKDTLSRPDLRMTVDTREDFKRISGIFTLQHTHPPWDITLDHAIKLMDQLKKTGKY